MDLKNSALNSLGKCLDSGSSSANTLQEYFRKVIGFNTSLFKSVNNGKGRKYCMDLT